MAHRARSGARRTRRRRNRRATHLSGVQIRNRSSHVRCKGQSQSPRERMRRQDVLSKIATGHVFRNNTGLSRADFSSADTYNTRPSSPGAFERPRKRTMLGCLHSRMIRHSRSKYLCTWTSVLILITTRLTCRHSMATRRSSRRTSYSVEGRTSLIAISTPRYEPSHQFTLPLAAARLRRYDSSRSTIRTLIYRPEAAGA